MKKVPRFVLRMRSFLHCILNDFPHQTTYSTSRKHTCPHARTHTRVQQHNDYSALQQGKNTHGTFQNSWRTKKICQKRTRTSSYCQPFHDFGKQNIFASQPSPSLSPSRVEVSQKLKVRHILRKTKCLNATSNNHRTILKV